MHRAAVYLVVFLTAFAVVLIPAAPASAHTVSGVGATNFKTTLVSITPAEPGLHVKVVENGSRLELTNNANVDVIVLGYNDPPEYYLRVGPDGVYENVNSPATYLNRTRQGGAVPPGLDPNAVPVWRKVASGHTAVWHDHRIHWMGTKPPPPVRAHPSVEQQVGPDWVVHLLRGGAPVEVTGTLTWVPGPSAWPWLAMAAVLLAATVVGAASRRWAPTLAVSLVLLIAVDAAHAVGVAFDYAGSLSRHLVLIVTASYYSIIAWALGLFGLRLLVRRQVDGLFVSLFCGLVIVVFGGIADFRVLDRSTAPFALPIHVERGLVTASIGLGLGLVIGSVWAFRRNNEPLRPTTDAAPAPSP